MAGFHTKTFEVYDDYMTPKYAWENIKHIIPKDKVIWESFYGNGESGTFLQELGFETIHKNIDFFKNNLGDIIVSNPPFKYKKEVFTRLKELGKPFIIICPCSMINTQYFRKLFSKEEEPIKIIIPRKRIQFKKIDKDGNPIETKGCNFDCFYYCWKIPALKRDITWLE